MCYIAANHMYHHIQTKMPNSRQVLVAIDARTTSKIMIATAIIPLTREYHRSYSTKISYEAATVVLLAVLPACIPTL